MALHFEIRHARCYDLARRLHWRWLEEWALEPPYQFRTEPHPGLRQAVRNWWGRFMGYGHCLRCQRGWNSCVTGEGVPLNRDGTIARWFIEGWTPKFVYGPGDAEHVARLGPPWAVYTGSSRFALCRDCEHIAGHKGMLFYDAARQEVNKYRLEQGH